MGMSHKFPSFSFELRIIQAQNIESIKSTKNSLFARFYLPIGNNNQRIQLNTKKVSSKSIFPLWNESFNLECSYPQEFFETLKEESMMLELRQSKKAIWGSHVVGKGEIPWKKILESPNMMFKEWVKMDLVSRSDCEKDMLKEPKVQVQVEVEIKIKVNSMNEKENRLNKWDECGCNHGHDQHAWLSVEDYDNFAFVGTTLEAF